MATLKRRIRVYEIEHDGDLDNAVSDLSLCGAANIEVIECDFDGEESALLRFEIEEENLSEFRAKARELLIT
jgi:hypothetical protein